MEILLIGQCTLHWGRMEFGNIGNYYIMEPLIRKLHETFPGAKIKTTFQMSDEFCRREKVRVLPMDLYYGWNKSDLDIALKEISLAYLYNKTGSLITETPYINEVLSSDMVIDFSGDIWGDNANFLGPDRFLVGLCKDRVAQLLNKPTVMLAGSPGPFEDQETIEFAKEVYANFDVVTNREPISKNILDDYGFDTSKTYSLACPSFLFEPDTSLSFNKFLKREKLTESKRPAAGFITCGWNFTNGPFDKWPRQEEEYEQFIDAVSYMINELGMDVFLMSHSNGFPIPPKDFELQHGRDYPISKQLYHLLKSRGIKKHLYLVEGVYNAWETKAVIGNFDFLVSGRVHGAIAGLSQSVPTVIIDYGHEPKAHKLEGFAKVAKVEEFIAEPSSDILIETIKNCWMSQDQVRKNLQHELLEVHKLIDQNFSLIMKYNNA